jgi:hypothetical protein
MHEDMGITWIPVGKRLTYYLYLGIVQCHKCRKWRVVNKCSFRHVKHKDLCKECVAKEKAKYSGRHKQWGIWWIPVTKTKNKHLDYIGIIQCARCREWRPVFKDNYYKDCYRKKTMCQKCRKTKEKIHSPFNSHYLVSDMEYWTNLNRIMESLAYFGIDTKKKRVKKATPLESVMFEGEEYFIQKYKGQLKYLE